VSLRKDITLPIESTNVNLSVSMHAYWKLTAGCSICWRMLAQGDPCYKHTWNRIHAEAKTLVRDQLYWTLNRVLLLPIAA